MKFKDIKTICENASGNLYYGADEIGIYYAQADEKRVVLDISNGWGENWEHILAKDVMSDLCSKTDEWTCAEDDWEVVVDCCAIVEVTEASIENGNVICR